ncbi:MAG: hypothetical protein IKI33_02755 [Eubacterium sp.]|nr:hypothetical protein [Eubacterium sp.]
MLKGVNKQILEITNTESPYFEKIIFFVRPSGAKLSEGALQREAEKYSRQPVKPPKTRKSKREKLTTLLCVLLGLGAGAALTVIMGIIA